LELLPSENRVDAAELSKDDMDAIDMIAYLFFLLYLYRQF